MGNVSSITKRCVIASAGTMGAAVSFCLHFLTIFALSAFLFGCKNASTISGFRFSTDRFPAATQGTWSSASIIDNGAGAIVNADQSTFCNAGVNSFTSATGKGCMQAPTITYTNSSRFMVGFPQVNLMNASFSDLFASFSNATTGLFSSTPYNVDESTLNAARYLKSVKLSTGEVLNVYFAEDGVPTRRVFANIYNPTTDTWGGDTELGTGAAVLTDSGSDGLSTNTNSTALCRPDVAAGGDGSAMVVWCEDTGASDSQAYYNYYSSGSWSGPTKMNDSAGSWANVAFPGFFGNYFDIVTTAPASPTFASTDLINIGFKISKPGAVNQTKTYRMYAKSGAADSGQFKIVTDSSGNQLVCKTIDNFIASLQSALNSSLGTTPPITTSATWSAFSFNITVSDTTGLQPGMVVSSSTGTIPAGTYIYSIDRVSGSIALNVNTTGAASNSLVTFSPESGYKNLFTLKKSSACTDTLTTCAGTNCRVYVYFNRALTQNFYDTALTQYFQKINTVVPIGTNYSMTLGTKFDTSDALASVNMRWKRSAGVAVAGDKNGNYSVVRTGISPFFTESTTLEGASEVGAARSLLGHEYVAGSGFKKDLGVTTNPEKTTRVSPEPKCATGSNPAYTACSVRNPKILMSNNGKGLIFFYQNQPTYSGISSYGGVLANPNRLWFSNYSTSSGFTGTAGIMDDTAVCNTSALANDVPVCETGSYSMPCQALSETQTLTAGLPGYKYESTPAAINIDHDIPPIAADMNANGEAVVGYHKPVNTGTSIAPVCTSNTALFVRYFNTVSGFSSATQIDTGLGYAMHASVRMASDGTAAAVWEEVQGTNVYVYFSKYTGTWSTAKVLVSSTTADTDSMMPSVQFGASSNEILVSYSLGLTSGTRRQYMVKYAVR